MDYYTGRVIISESEYDNLHAENQLLKERVQELEEDIKQRGEVIRYSGKKLDELEQDIERYKQAIEKAIGGCRYTKPEVAYILSQALKGVEG
ncbi:hypothetical protein [Virgibacillus salexigens]|uniref:Uncharacterized protein n=1 Tax=Virgibacillus kapii TaxID=1638645 RepID=A0ABQ2D7P2_9BACI|nr:hypothetical protein [Virgibacillus kapii]GGJ48888.1 hypothetical protein GCM10007111_08660 [Virgibacillus kapii]